jgi:hypothetical protein
MTHPDDAARPADPKFIDILIEAAAPEMVAEWKDLRERCGITFHPIADRKGVTLRARGRRVEFDNKTMTWLWLLGFTGWQAFHLHGPHLVYRKLADVVIDQDLRSADLKYQAAEGDLDELLYTIRDAPALKTLDCAGFWPDKVPQPQCDKTGLDVEQQAAFDLTMIAAAYMILHEVRHVMFNADVTRPSEPDEEVACDAWARAFLLDRVSEYATDVKQQAECIRAKRAAGIALGAFAIHEFTPEGARGGTAEYPPLADRLGGLVPHDYLPSDHWFWDFAASLLVAIIVRRDRKAVVPDLHGSDLCQALVCTLRKMHST